MAADAPRPPRPALSPACSRRCAARRLRRRLGRLDRRPRREAPKAARRRRRASSRAPKGGLARRGPGSGRRPSELVVSPAGDGLLPGREPLSRSASSNSDRSQVTDAEVALYLSQGAEGQPGGRNRRSGSQGRRCARAQQRSPRRAGGRPLPGLDRKPRHPARLPRARPPPTTPTPRRVVYSTDIDFPSDGEWRIAAVIKEGDEAEATLLPSAVVGEFNRIPRPGEKAPLIHTPTAAGRRRRPLEDHDPDPAGHPEQGRLRGRAREGTDRALVCDPPVLPESGLRPRRRRGRAGQSRNTETRRPSSTWRSTTTTTRRKGVRPQVRAFHLPTRALAVRDRPRRRRSGDAIEGAFGLDADAPKPSKRCRMTPR